MEDKPASPPAPAIDKPMASPLIENNHISTPIANIVTKAKGKGRNGNLIPPKKGEIRNPKGGMSYGTMKRVRAIMNMEGFSPEQVASRMTGWLNTPMWKLKERIQNDNCQAFECLGASIILHAIETGDTGRLDTLLDRVIGPVIQRTQADIRTLSVTAKADADLLDRIRGDMLAGKTITHDDASD